MQFRCRARFFVADIGVAHEPSMVIDGSPPVLAHFKYPGTGDFHDFSDAIAKLREAKAIAVVALIR